MPPLVVVILIYQTDCAFIKVVLGVGGKEMCSFDYNFVLRTPLRVFP